MVTNYIATNENGNLGKAQFAAPLSHLIINCTCKPIRKTYHLYDTFHFCQLFLLIFYWNSWKAKNNAAEFLLFSDVHQNILHLLVFMLPLCCCIFSKWLSLCSLSMNRWLAHCCRESTGSFIGVLMGMTQIQKPLRGLGLLFNIHSPVGPTCLVWQPYTHPKGQLCLVGARDLLYSHLAFWVWSMVIVLLNHFHFL